MRLAPLTHLENLAVEKLLSYEIMVTHLPPLLEFQKVSILQFRVVAHLFV